MRLLLISPIFNSYHELLLKEMSLLDVEAVHFSDKPLGLIYRIFSFFSSSIKAYLDKRYLDNIIHKIKHEEYSHVLVIKGTVLDEDFIFSLKRILPSARFIMYQWDSTFTHISYTKIAGFFDKVFTFDMKDAKDYKFEYLPLFYSRLYENLIKKPNPKFDLVFVGEYYPDSDRLSVVKRVAALMEKQGASFCYSLRVEFFALFKFILFGHLKIKDLPYISIGRISQKEVIDLYSDATAVLDIEHKKQNGLTIRTMEVLGAGIRLVTTNKNIINEDFFAKDSIEVIDREEPKIDLSFFSNNENVSLDKKYSINSWLSHILQH